MYRNSLTSYYFTNKYVITRYRGYLIPITVLLNVLVQCTGTVRSHYCAAKSVTTMIQDYPTPHNCNNEFVTTVCRDFPIQLYF